MTWKLSPASLQDVQGAFEKLKLHNISPVRETLQSAFP